jgi:hypothetical protein
LLENEGLSEGIESALPYGSGSERVEIIETLIFEIAALDKKLQYRPITR